jgi:hypothetical protein
MACGSINITAMRWQSLIMLIAIAVSTAASPSLPLTIVCDREAMIGMLNVSNSVTPALSSNGDMPCVNERPRSRVLFLFVTSRESPQFFLIPMLMPKMNEHPPKA